VPPQQFYGQQRPPAPPPPFNNAYFPGWRPPYPPPHPQFGPPAVRFPGKHFSILLLHSGNVSRVACYARITPARHASNSGASSHARVMQGLLAATVHCRVSTQFRHPSFNLLPKLLRCMCRTRSFRRGEGLQGRRPGRRRRAVAVAVPLQRRRRSSTLTRHVPSCGHDPRRVSCLISNRKLRMKPVADCRVWFQEVATSWSGPGKLVKVPGRKHCTGTSRQCGLFSN